MHTFKNTILSITCLMLLLSCSQPSGEEEKTESMAVADSIVQPPVEVEEVIKDILPEDIILEKELTYDKYTLEDTYPYRDTTRVFQWDKIRVELAKLENAQRTPQVWGVLQNRRNVNGTAPLVKNYYRNKYKNIADTLGTEKHQSAPLYLTTDTITPEIYANDGTLIRFIGREGTFVHAEKVYGRNEWMIPEKYIKRIDSVTFERVAVVDRTHQNIATLEKSGDRWLIRSMNPATTGGSRPPYQKLTPLGIYVVQEKKEKMFYLKDGTSTIAGYSPWASRFCMGGYIHGIPVNYPRQTIIEYSASLGTTPRSHMCVRNASSHAKYVYDWAPVDKSLVIVIE